MAQLGCHNSSYERRLNLWESGLTHTCSQAVNAEALKRQQLSLAIIKSSHQILLILLWRSQDKMLKDPHGNNCSPRDD